MKALVFDFGGTIDTDGVHWSEKFRDAYASAGIILDKEDFDEAYVIAEQQMQKGAIRNDDGLHVVLSHQVRLQLAALCRNGVVEESTLPADIGSQIAAACFHEVEKNIEELRSLLSRWSRGWKLGLVSNFYGNLPAVCAGLGIASFFGAIVDSHAVHLRKPDPEIFNIVLDQLQTSATETFVVGDSYERDIVPAKVLGCTTVWVRKRPWRVPSNSSQADHIIRSLHELQAVIGERSHHEEREEY